MSGDGTSRRIPMGPKFLKTQQYLAIQKANYEPERGEPSTCTMVVSIPRLLLSNDSLTVSSDAEIRNFLQLCRTVACFLAQTRRLRASTRTEDPDRPMLYTVVFQDPGRTSLIIPGFSSDTTSSRLRGSSSSWLVCLCVSRHYSGGGTRSVSS